MSAADLKKLLPLMQAQKDAAFQRMSALMEREGECQRVLDKLDREERHQVAAAMHDSVSSQGLVQWKVWANAERTRANLRLAAIRAERETHAKKLGVLVGRQDVTNKLIKEELRQAERRDQIRAEEGD